MVRINEDDPILEVLQFADKTVTLPSGHRAIVVETGGGIVSFPYGTQPYNVFEGTLLYVPGVHFKELGLK